MSFETACDAATAARLVACLDLTSLGDDDDAAGAARLAERARDAGVAAVCLWPRFIPEARAVLDGTTVRIATVANFPDGSDDLGRAADETAAAFAAGAHEVDVVVPVDAVLAGDVGLVEELVELCVAPRPLGGRIKVILETGRLAEPSTITAAARAAIMAGADMLKTSTGKTAVGATPEAVRTLAEVVAEAGGRVGIKVAGAVRTAEQAAGYLAIVERRLGAGWGVPATFRIGASSLLDALVARR